MNPNYHIHEQIDRYLKNNLSEEELAQFNKNLLNNVEFKETFEAQKEAHELIVDNELVKLKERMSKDLSNGSGTDSSNWGKIILLSAAIGSVAVFSYVQYNNYKSVPDSIQKENISIQKDLSIHNNINENVVTENNNGNTTVTKIPSTERNNNNTNDKSTVLTEENTTPDNKLSVEKEQINTVPFVQENNKITTEHNTLIPDNNKVVVNCETTVITASVKVSYTNKEEATIVVDKASVEGGSPPYLFSLNQNSFDADNRFDDIKDGSYHVYIKDQNGCVSEIKKEVVVKIPQKEIDDVFAPSMGEKWNLPIKENTNASITIINKAGLTVYSATINGGYPNEWDGRDTNGNELNTGNYYFIINFANNELLKGHISIVK
jgi:hypothetical protein